MRHEEENMKEAALKSETGKQAASFTWLASFHLSGLKGWLSTFRFDPFKA
jgi:hypothetical protein